MSNNSNCSDGTIDAGKSTLSGHIMYCTGMLDDRTLEKYEREAKSKNRESWKFAWALDTTDQERAKVWLHNIMLPSIYGY